MFVESKKIIFNGWIRKQLECQWTGLFGNLDKIWKDVRDSKWLNGNEEGWERFPYYLNGLIPLAYALKDAEIIEKANKYIDIIINCQRDDGRICPENDTDVFSNDLWSMFLILKVLTIYAEVSENNKADNAIVKGLEYINASINKNTIINWAHARYFECFIPLLYLKKKKLASKQFITELTIKLKSQGLDYKIASALWKKSSTRWAYDNHGVNIMMALKASSLYEELIGIKDFDAKEMIKILDKYHGNAYGHFNLDECLAPVGPNYGSELCSIVEAMYSYEILFNLTNDTYWLDRLERLAFNGLPATISDDMWSHQYDQQVNQLNCSVHNKKSYFRTNSVEANVFGLEPHFGCCTANFGQGWPLFALSAFSYYKDYLQINIPLSASVNLDNGLVVKCESEYPFRNKVTLWSNKDTKIRIKVSKNCYLSRYKCKEGFITINLKANETKDLFYKMELQLETRKNSFRTLNYGPILFSIPLKHKLKIVEYTKNNVERKFPYCDYYYELNDEWRYGFINKSFKIVEKEYNLPFDRKKPPLILEGEFALLNWEIKKGYQNIPQDKYININKRKIKLKMQPYGSTYLRMTEIPLVEKGANYEKKI